MHLSSKSFGLLVPLSSFGKFGLKGIIGFFWGSKLMNQQVWKRVFNMIQETLEAKYEVSYPLERGDEEIVNSLGLRSLMLTLLC